MPLSRFVSCAVALVLAAGVTVAAQNSGAKDSGKKSDGAVTDVAKATAGGAKKLGLGIKDAVTPGNDDKDKEKK